MESFISKHQCKIVDFLSIPIIPSKNSGHADFTREEEKFVLGILDDQKALQKLLEPYHDRLQKYSRDYEGTLFIEALYRYLLEEGYDLQDITELYPLLLDIPEEKLSAIYLNFMTPDDLSIDNEHDFLNFIEEDDHEDDCKWRILWSYHHLKETVAGMIDLYKDIIPIYQPFYHKYEAEIDQMIETIDIIDLYRGSVFDLEAFLSQNNKSKIHLFVLSSIYLANTLITDESDPEKPVYIYTYAMAEKFFKGRQQSNLEKDTLDLTIKSLSDPVRYDILSIVSHTSLKNKEIAAKLMTTPANVSFHIQKLLNAGLLNFAIDHCHAKYQLNKSLLSKCLNKIKADFDLE